MDKTKYMKKQIKILRKGALAENKKAVRAARGGYQSIAISHESKALDFERKADKYEEHLNENTN